MHLVIQAFIGLLLVWLATGCQTSHSRVAPQGVTPLGVRKAPSPPAAQTQPALAYAPPRATRGAVMEPNYRRENDSALRTEAFRWLGVPYRVGGMTKAGADCSGFTCAIFQTVYGIKLPRTSMTQFGYGAGVPLRGLREGDLVFFQTSNQAPVTHVGIYLDNGRFIHSSTKRGVIVSQLSEGYYSERFRGARRVPAASARRVAGQ